MSEAYPLLQRRFHDAGILRSFNRLLTWDRHVAMPAEGVDTKAEMEAFAARARNELLRGDDLPDLLARAAEEDLTAWQRANLREMRRIVLRERALDPMLVEAFGRHSGRSMTVWAEARRQNDFPMYRDLLAESVRLKREMAAALGQALDLQPYDALLDEYEPGLRRATIDPLFGELETFLRGYVPDAAARGRSNDAAGVDPVPADRLQQVCRQIVASTGFDLQRGRFDVALQPFCMGVGPGDTRVVADMVPELPLNSVMATLHEVGHGLYEAGLPGDHAFQPVGLPRGSAVHESQALLFEMQVGREPGYLDWLAGQIGCEPARLRSAMFTVQPSLIRVSADEATYPLHVILRYRVETALFDGSIEAADVPEMWNRLSRELLGIEPPDYSTGCLQDIHWANGLFGYFPTYALGAMIAAQLFQAACSDRPEIPSQLAGGSCAGLLAWLRERVHVQGSHPASFQDLMVQATGRQLGTEAFQARIRERYG